MLIKITHNGEEKFYRLDEDREWDVIRALRDMGIFAEGVEIEEIGYEYLC